MRVFISARFFSFFLLLLRRVSARVRLFSLHTLSFRTSRKKRIESEKERDSGPPNFRDRTQAIWRNSNFYLGPVFFFCTQGKSSGLHSNTKARSAAVHYKQLLAVGPEKLYTIGTEKRHGDTETYKAPPRKNIFRTFNVVRRNISK